MNEYKERIRQAIEYAEKTGSFSRFNILEKAEHVCIYGLGRFFDEAFLRKRIKESFHVDMLCDKNYDKALETVKKPEYADLKAVSLDELSQMKSVYVIVMMGNPVNALEDIGKRIGRQNCVWYLDISLDLEICPDEKYRGNDYFESQIKEIYAAYDMLEDDISRANFANVLCDRIAPHLAVEEWNFPNGVEYFDSTVYDMTEHESVVDGGAYNGDTLESFLQVCSNQFDNYYAFELDTQNAGQVRHYTDTLSPEIAEKIKCYENALWNQCETISFQRDVTPVGTSGMGYSIYNKVLDMTASAEAVNLDAVLQDKKITLIKMDIEGAEQNALRGAEEIIRKQKPKMAICVYHRMEDMWKIPLYLHKIVPDYHFKMRHYSFMRSSEDIVCYAFLK